MDIRKVENIYFLGIGGIGMSALARYYMANGYHVAGYDRTPSEITESLIREGAEVTFDENPSLIPARFTNKENTLVVYTPAVPESHKGFVYFRTEGFELVKRAKALGIITNAQKCLAVAGTHGKTSVSTGLASILHESHVGCSAFLGGISKNYGTNNLINRNSDFVVVEADEFDRSFLQLYPEVAILTAMDADHLDIYGTPEAVTEAFYQFVSQIKPFGSLVYKKNLPINRDLYTGIRYYTYSLDEEADFTVKDVKIVDGWYHFTMVTPNETIENLVLGVPGRYNLENALASSAVAWLVGVKADELRKALAAYNGVKRRFDFYIRSSELVLIDDYAHHPDEIKACIKSVRELYPNKEITGVFQPHLYSRTRDFADGFAVALSMCDQVYLTDLYPARELPIEGISSYTILDKMTIADKKVVAYNKLVEAVAENHKSVIVVMGAGDIDRLVKPLKEVLA